MEADGYRVVSLYYTLQDAEGSHDRPLVWLYNHGLFPSVI